MSIFLSSNIYDEYEVLLLLIPNKYLSLIVIHRQECLVIKKSCFSLESP